MPLKFPLHPTTSSSFHHTIRQQQSPILSPLIPMILATKINTSKYPYSPPSSTFSPPLTPCQDSPPSESDDLCSACRGAGEFVCCESCPRVFHFLCCDPPRLDAPSGEFYCHVCEVKKKTTDEFTSETPLAPLFQSLESINARAFALPADIQNHFENVAARADGSYYEDIKKLPL